MSNSPPDGSQQHHAVLTMAADIVSAYVTKNAVPASDLPSLIGDVHTKLARLASGMPDEPVETRKEPAVSIKKSVTADFIICLEDGQKFKSLKRHLGATYGLTPDEYRKKWSLPADYPMVAPSYSTARSVLAKEARFGQKAKTAPAKPKAARENAA